MAYEITKITPNIYCSLKEVPFAAVLIWMNSDGGTAEL